MSDLIYFMIMIGLGYFVGSQVERAHYRQIGQREKALLSLPAVSGQHFVEDRPITRAELVMGNVVVSHDYFKLIFAGLRNILGGEMAPYETLLDRARREAVLRLKEKAPGADLILNLKIETCQITMSGSAEALAYGTAVYYQK